jgi:hypothetical protein
LKNNFITKTYPKLKQLFDLFDEYEFESDIYSTQRSSFFIKNFIKGMNGELSESAIKTNDADTFNGSDDHFLVDTNKTTEYTHLRLTDNGLDALTKSNFNRNSDFILSVFDEIKRMPINLKLQAIILILFDVFVEIRFGDSFLGRLDYSLKLDDSSIKFNDDGKYQVHSIIIYSPIDFSNDDLILLTNLCNIHGSSLYVINNKMVNYETN